MDKHMLKLALYIKQSTSARDSTPEPTVPKPKKQKTRNKANKERNAAHSNEDSALNNDDDFVMSSKSKLHKKIKVNPKDAFGGNIHLPRYKMLLWIFSSCEKSLFEFTCIVLFPWF